MRTLPTLCSLWAMHSITASLANAEPLTIGDTVLLDSAVLAPADE